MGYEDLYRSRDRFVGSSEGGRIFESPLNIVDVDYVDVPPATEVTFDPAGKMFQLRNDDMDSQVYYGFISGNHDRNLPLFPRSLSRVLNPQGVVYLWHNGSSSVRVYCTRLELIENA